MSSGLSCPEARCVNDLLAFTAEAAFPFEALLSEVLDGFPLSWMGCGGFALDLCFDFEDFDRVQFLSPTVLPDCSSAFEPPVSLFAMFDIVQLVQTIRMGAPFVLAFFNFLRWLLENAVTGRLC